MRKGFGRNSRNGNPVVIVRNDHAGQSFLPIAIADAEEPVVRKIEKRSDIRAFGAVYAKEVVVKFMIELGQSDVRKHRAEWSGDDTLAGGADRVVGVAIGKAGGRNAEVLFGRGMRTEIVGTIDVDGKRKMVEEKVVVKDVGGIGKEGMFKVDGFELIIHTEKGETVIDEDKFVGRTSVGIEHGFQLQERIAAIFESDGEMSGIDDADERGNENGGENRNDGDDDDKFNDRKSPFEGKKKLFHLKSSFVRR